MIRLKARATNACSPVGKSVLQGEIWEKCVVLQHVMHGFPGVAIWLSCMHTSH